MFHKVQKALLLETDVAETANECILSVRKMGSVGLISAYAGITNAFNIGAVMESGIRVSQSSNPGMRADNLPSLLFLVHRKRSS